MGVGIKIIPDIIQEHKALFTALSIIIFLINNIFIWFQLNGQLVWDFWKSWKGLTISLLMGIPISALFWLGTKLGYYSFGNLWSIRFIGFATSMITFPFMTYWYLGEMMTLKIIICVVLAMAILLIQVI